MSLSRILNNDAPLSRSTGGHSPYGTRPKPSVDVETSSPSKYSETPHSPFPTYIMYPDQLKPLPSRTYGHQAHSNREVRDQDAHTDDWPQGANPYSGGGDDVYSDWKDMSPRESREPPAMSYDQAGQLDLEMKKRRRGIDDDTEYLPPGQRRLSLRKDLSKENSPFLSPEEAHRANFNLPEDETRLISSDLEDCQEIWTDQLGHYVLETHKRLHQVGRWFEASVLERNSTAAQRMSHHYSRRLTRLPIPATPVPLPNNHPSSPILNLTYGYHNPGQSGSTRSVGMEGAAGFLPLRKGKIKEPVNRLTNEVVSDVSSDLDIPLPLKKDQDAPLAKRRKFDRSGPDITDELERSIVGDTAASSTVKSLFAKGKGKQIQQRELSQDSMTPRPLRKKPGPRKRLDTLPPETLELLGLGSVSASVSGDVTPSLSRPASPALTSNLVYELDDLIPPLKKAKKVDDAAMAKRLKSLEEAQRKVWTNIAKRDIAKVYKHHAMGYQSRQSQMERIARFASIQARRPFTRTPKSSKDIQVKGKRLMREMQVFWKKNEREERDMRKREQKEANDRAKFEEEKREAARQARKLEFLISQTELYSHFVENKLKTSEVEGEGEALPVPIGATVEDIDPRSLHDINFDDDDPTNLHRHAKYNAQEAIALAKQRAQQFDTQAALERKTNEALKLAKAQAHIRDDINGEPSNSALVDLDSDELNFQNPTSLNGMLTVRQPKMLMAQLKEYQLKGLNWLATLYEQGINGILADEMGLGKTVQSVSLLSYLAETHDIWGPFLVVAPASTLHNWQQELTRFVPGLKALPYWGNVKDRTTLRKFWSKKEISYNQDAPFHVLITSYQLVTQDQQYFQRVKWQYMILDEAQNIKNSSSVRWKTLLGFHCRNRLLLTGTPIQNNMQELWALLHFIMPSLFDSHDEFNEWFSKDIENAAENRGSKLNEHQLRRLHMILKPFMLRRVKRHVQNELSDKIEKDIYVDLSARQRALYKALLANVSVADLLEKAANIGDADSARSLMNLVMQFRKVCNHPELFERADIVAPFSFSHFGRSGPLMRDSDPISLSYSTRNPIEYSVPKIFYQDGGLLYTSSKISTESHGGYFNKLLNIWSTNWIHRSLYDDDAPISSFAFLRLLNMSPSEAHTLHVTPLIRKMLLGLQDETSHLERAPYSLDSTFAAYNARGPLKFDLVPTLLCLDVADGLPDLGHIAENAWAQSCLSRPDLRWHIPPVVAPIISLYCPDRTFLDRQSQLLEAPMESLALYGLSPNLRESEDACKVYRNQIPGLSVIGLIGNSSSSQLPSSTMQVPEAKRLIYDSAKLARLDSLLYELKAGDHRVLVYFQMTRMMDLMEEYLIYRQYKYLRLDGSSKLEDRRDMVIDWQTKPDYFVFLLSTRAGGLGINLTAADTVVFYDHDWNPSNDAQAMDRAHRLGQTRQVTVYRLITRGTIDERIVQLARVKKDVQDIVVGNKSFTDVTKPSEIVQLLLNDEQLATLDTGAPTKLSSGKASNRPMRPADDGGVSVRDLWNDEGDDFFGHSGGAISAVVDGAGAEDENVTPGLIRGRAKKRKAGGLSRGRKPVGGKIKPTRGDGE